MAVAAAAVTVTARSADRVRAVPIVLAPVANAGRDVTPTVPTAAVPAPVAAEAPLAVDAEILPEALPEQRKPLA